MDEARFGLLSIQRRCLTARGIKPITPYQHRFKNFYLFGAYSPVNGDHFTLEFPYCNSACFEQYLEFISTHSPDEFKILLLDNGAFHKAKQLAIPHNTEFHMQLRCASHKLVGVRRRVGYVQSNVPNPPEICAA